jgi:acetyltransferase-like isoleucine patch superfamily enzyme
MADIQGKIMMKARSWRLKALEWYSKCSMELELALKKVKVGTGVRFWGSMYIVRYPESAITIGDKCSFRSDKNSNMIGVNRNCMLSTHSSAAEISIGNNCGFSGTVIGAKEKIVIGNDVLCGANTLITDFDWHGVAPDQRRSSTGDSKPISIGNNVFIGYGSAVLKGVTIGDNSVIGANSVVTRNIPANVIAGGNPCKVIKEL